MAKPMTKQAVASYKARFLASLNGASFAKLKECETILRVSMAKSRAGERFQASPEELQELLDAVLSMMSRKS